MSRPNSVSCAATRSPSTTATSSRASPPRSWASGQRSVTSGMSDRKGTPPTMWRAVGAGRGGAGGAQARG
ncbi:hypothetical protein GAY28_33310 [Azospirillum brasilense]|nr:hypothetical protein [Azospirillum brasilense]